MKVSIINVDAAKISPVAAITNAKLIISNETGTTVLELFKQPGRSNHFFLKWSMTPVAVAFSRLKEEMI